MSVINQMLTALDARNAPPQSRAEAAGVVPLAASRVALPPRRMQLVALAGTGLVLAVAFTNWPALIGGKPARLPVPLAASIEAAEPGASAPASLEASVPAAVAEAASAVASVSGAVLNRPASNKAAPAQRADAGSPSSTERVSWVRTKPQPAGLRKAPVGRDAAGGGPSAVAAPLPVQDAVADPIEKKPAVATSSAYRQATELADSGHDSTAIDKALEAVRLEPSHAAARQLAAVLLIEKRRPEEAVRLIQDGLALQPREPVLSYLLARLRVEADRVDEALALLAPPMALTAEGHGLRAALLTRGGRYREAISAYETAVRLAPANASWWLGLGVALDAAGEAVPARQAFQRARSFGTLGAEVQGYLDQKLGSIR